MDGAFNASVTGIYPLLRLRQHFEGRNYMLSSVVCRRRSTNLQVNLTDFKSNLTFTKADRLMGIGCIFPVLF